MDTSKVSRVTADDGTPILVDGYEELKCPVCGAPWFNYSHMVTVEYVAEVNGLWRVKGSGELVYPSVTAKGHVKSGEHKFTCMSCGTTYYKADPLLSADRSK